MTHQNHIDYDRIQKAIEFIQDNFKSQPSLEEIAASVHVSPHHFQRMFKEWAGISPKKFIQFTSIEHAKTLLNNHASLFETSLATGLSGPSRLHDLFISIEGMTPGEYKNGGASLIINYSYADTLFGPILVGSTSKGVCHLSFMKDKETALTELKLRFPNANYSYAQDSHQLAALQIFHLDWDDIPHVKLHLAGTPFQIKVWEALLQIPYGSLSSYGALAKIIEQPSASRAVGNAIGKNPIAYLIPCHRVIQGNGKIGNYMWGSGRKTAMIGFESSRTFGNE